MDKTTSIAVLVQSPRLAPKSSLTASPATAAAPRRAAVAGFVNNQLFIGSGSAMVGGFGLEELLINICIKMAKERKYLDEFEMSLLLKYGIKIIKKKYDVVDLLDMLPKRWKEYDNWVTINIWWDNGLSEWHCTTPYWYFEGAAVKATWNDVRGDTLLTCLLNAVLTLAKKDRRFLSKTYVVENWKYSQNPA